MFGMVSAWFSTLCHLDVPPARMESRKLLNSFKLKDMKKVGWETGRFSHAFR
jgi:hypothetical protein